MFIATDTNVRSGQAGSACAGADVRSPPRGTSAGRRSVRFVPKPEVVIGLSQPRVDLFSKQAKSTGLAAAQSRRLLSPSVWFLDLRMAVIMMMGTSGRITLTLEASQVRSCRAC